MEGERLSSQERGEEEPKPNEINIYVLEWAQTTEDRVSAQGFGTSQKLKTPIKHVFFIWEGQLYYPEDEMKRRELKSRGREKNIELLAKNFSWNYLGHQNLELQKKGEASYSLKFKPSDDMFRELERSYYGKDQRIRGLTEDEQQEFLEAFQRANKEEVKRQAEIKKVAKEGKKITLPPPPWRKKK